MFLFSLNLRDREDRLLVEMLGREKSLVLGVFLFSILHC